MLGDDGDSKFPNEELLVVGTADKLVLLYEGYRVNRARVLTVLE